MFGYLVHPLYDFHYCSVNKFYFLICGTINDVCWRYSGVGVGGIFCFRWRYPWILCTEFVFCWINFSNYFYVLIPLNLSYTSRVFIRIYYIDTSVLLENRSLVKFIRNYIRDPGGVFSISSLARISMTSFPASFCMVVCAAKCRLIDS